MAVASSRSAVGRHPQERLLRRRISRRCTPLPPQERPRAKVSSRSAARDLLQTPLCFNGSRRKETSTTRNKNYPEGTSRRQTPTSLPSAPSLSLPIAPQSSSFPPASTSPIRRATACGHL